MAIYTLEGYGENRVSKIDSNVEKRLAYRATGFLNEDTNDVGFIFVIVPTLFVFYYVFFQWLLMINASIFGYEIVTVGYSCSDILTVTDTQGQTCAWYDIGTNSDSCGAYDRIF